MARTAKPIQSKRSSARGGGLGEEGEEAGDGEEAEGEVDVEDGAPGEGLCQKSADGGAGDGADHDAHAEDGHDLGALFERVDIQHRGLGERDEGGAEHALQEAEGDDLFQGFGGTAEHGGDGEACHAGDVEVPAAEALGHPAHRGCHDRGGDDVAGEDPGDLV